MLGVAHSTVAKVETLSDRVLKNVTLVDGLVWCEAIPVNKIFINVFLVDAGGTV
jgi:hypothetical protein